MNAGSIPPPPHPVPSIASTYAQLDALIAPMLSGEWIAGAAIGLVSGPNTAFRAYGHATDGGPAPDENTVFEIGSVTKTFTALVLADMISRNELSIATTVQSLLPDGARAPGPTDRPMLLIDLATHMAGLPRLPPGFHPTDLRNPYANYHDADLFAALTATTLATPPGSEYAYSNFGFALLGSLLARHAHTTYAQLVADRITAPLGMSDTSVELSPAQRARLAQGHDVDGDPVPPWDQDAMAGAGALRSTARDMIRFVQANVAPPDALAQAIVASHALRHESENGYIAMAWNVRGDRKTLWHNGQTGGYHAYVGFDRRFHVGVVVLTNTAAEPVDELGLATLRLLRGQEIEPVELPPTIALDDAQLDRYAGTYRFAPGVELVVTHTPGVLRARLGNQPALRIHPSREHECRYRAVDASLTFTVDASGRATAVVLHQNRVDQRAERVP